MARIRSKTRKTRGGACRRSRVPKRMRGGKSRRGRKSRRGGTGLSTLSPGCWGNMCGVGGGRRIRGGRRTRGGKRARGARGGRRSRKYSRRGGGKPPTLIGYPLDGGNVATWPGIAAAKGISSCGTTQANYYPASKCGIPAGPCVPPVSSRNQTGGGLMRLFPQDLVNVGRSLSGGVTGAYDGWTGVQRLPNTYESPTSQKALQPQGTSAVPLGPDLQGIHTAAGQAVANL